MVVFVATTPVIVAQAQMNVSWCTSRLFSLDGNTYGHTNNNRRAEANQ